MLDILKQKMFDWTPGKASAFFNSVIDPSQEIYATDMWELSDTGYYLYSSRYAGYFDYNGRSYQIFTGDHTDSYELKKKLSESAEINKTTPVEKPTLIELVNVHGYVLTYVEQQRPYNCLGIGLMNLISVPENQLKSAFLDFLGNYLVGAEDLIRSFDTITQTQDRYPSSFDDFFRYDPVSDKFFWAGNFTFDHSRDDLIANLQNSLAIQDDVLAKNNHHISLKDETNNIIKSKCTIFQPL